MKNMKRWGILILIVILAGMAYLFSNYTIKMFSSVQKSYYKNYYRLSRRQTGSTASRIETVSFQSAALNAATRKYKIYLPESYDQNPEKRFPVLYLLHGYPGDEGQWLTNADIQFVLDDLIKTGRLKPLIVVFPDGNGPKITDSQYVNAKTKNQNLEDYIVSDLTKDVDGKFRTIQNRRSRAIGGNSSGAFGAVNLGLKHNSKFGVILSFSGYFYNWRNQLTDTLGKDQKAINDNSPAIYLNSITIDPATYIYLIKGTRDWGSLGELNVQFAEQLKAKNVNYDLSSFKGIHGWGLWTAALPSALDFLNQHLQY